MTDLFGIRITVNPTLPPDSMMLVARIDHGIQVCDGANVVWISDAERQELLRARDPRRPPRAEMKISEAKPLTRDEENELRQMVEELTEDGGDSIYFEIPVTQAIRIFATIDKERAHLLSVQDPPR